MPIPLAVTQEQVNEALKPLCDLLGTTVHNFYSLTLRDSVIHLSVPARHEDDPDGRADSAHARGKSHYDGDAPHPQGLKGHLPVVHCSEGYEPEWAFSVKVAVMKPKDLD